MDTVLFVKAAIFEVTILVASDTPQWLPQVLVDINKVTIQIRSWSTQFAVSALAHCTLRLAVNWPGDHFSGFLHHSADMIELGVRLFSSSRSLRCCLMVGSKIPLQETNLNITGYF